MQMCNGETGQHVRSVILRGQDGFGIVNVFSPDHKRLASVLPARMVRLWDLDTQKEVWRIH